MNRFRLLVLGLGLLAVAVGAVWPAPVPGASAQAKGLDDLLMDVNIAPLDPQAPPPLSVTTLEGVRVSLADIKNQPVIVYFWATW